MKKTKYFESKILGEFLAFLQQSSDFGLFLLNNIEEPHIRNELLTLPEELLKA